MAFPSPWQKICQKEFLVTVNHGKAAINHGKPEYHTGKPVTIIHLGTLSKDWFLRGQTQCLSSFLCWLAACDRFKPPPFLGQLVILDSLSESLPPEHSKTRLSREGVHHRWFTTMEKGRLQGRKPPGRLRQRMATLVNRIRYTNLSSTS